MNLLTALVLAGSCVAGCLAAPDPSSDSPLVATTLEFLARASSTSEVLTLNLINALILGAIAAGIIIFGLFGGFGFGDDDGLNRRSNDGNVPDIFTQSALTGGMCFIMYTSGAEEKMSCIQRSACEDPKTANDYLTAAKMWYKMHKLLKVVPFTDPYYKIMTSVQEAADAGIAGNDCAAYPW